MTLVTPTLLTKLLGDETQAGQHIARSLQASDQLATRRFKENLCAFTLHFSRWAAFPDSRLHHDFYPLATPKEAAKYHSVGLDVTLKVLLESSTSVVQPLDMFCSRPEGLREGIDAAVRRL